MTVAPPTEPAAFSPPPAEPRYAPCSLVFLDPPYGQGLIAPALAALDKAGWVAPGALIVADWTFGIQEQELQKRIENLGMVPTGVPEARERDLVRCGEHRCELARAHPAHALQFVARVVAT